jgi:5-methylcytosine-specific restriction endonuclease McrA
MTKVCVKCGSSEFSTHDNCVPCKRTYDKAYRATNKEKVAAAKKKAYVAKSDHYIKKSHDHYHSNKPEIAVKSRVYRESNKVAILEGKRLYRQNNVDKIAISEKEYYEKNKEYVDRRQRLYALANPEVYANSYAKRRSRIGDDKLSPGLFTKLFVEQFGSCNGCRIDLSSNRKSVHIDHIMPLALGGRNTDDNVQLLCAKCNQTKSAKHPDYWRLLTQKPQISSSTS